MNVAEKVEHEYSQVKINTKFGRFNIRVYSDQPNKETVIIWTEDLDVSKPALVRVHSECLTGDVIGSLQCDCGDQLESSLTKITKEGGILIYLRQEGRGIGLFEKIKAYQLQADGFDTFEANVKLGHKPDARTYEFVKISLDDLGVKSIKLLTNNPSKISEIAKLGINVVERIPLIMDSNIHNERYYKTKNSKFQHFLQSNQSNYLYQCQIENPEQASEIGLYTHSKKRDPLLKIAVGFFANSSSLNNISALINIRNIIKQCVKYNLIPILHFSFSESNDEMSDIIKIKELLPEIYHIQINDVKDKLTIKQIVRFIDDFSLYVPLSSENFDLVDDNEFCNLLLSKKSYVSLDNSKGNGINLCFKEIKSKIEKLLNFGLNNIILAGGFGPDELSSYFEARRYYRINLSIDAETGLKTNGNFDIEKAKIYLFQLLRFDDPNIDAINNTQNFIQSFNHHKIDEITLDNNRFSISKGVFHSGFFPSSRWFTSKLIARLKNTTDFCQIGSGSGVTACYAAIKHPDLNVVATDINPIAIDNIKQNALNHNISNRVEVILSDVFDAVPNGKKFDSIFWLMPFGYLDPSSAKDLEKLQFFDPGYKGIRKYLSDAKNFLKPGGELLFGFSPDIGNQSLLHDISKNCGLTLTVLDETVVSEKTDVRMQLISGVYNG